MMLTATGGFKEKNPTEVYMRTTEVATEGTKVLLRKTEVATEVLLKSTEVATEGTVVLLRGTEVATEDTYM